MSSGLEVLSRRVTTDSILGRSGCLRTCRITGYTVLQQYFCENSRSVHLPCCDCLHCDSVRQYCWDARDPRCRIDLFDFLIQTHSESVRGRSCRAKPPHLDGANRDHSFGPSGRVRRRRHAQKILREPALRQYHRVSYCSSARQRQFR